MSTEEYAQKIAKAWPPLTAEQRALLQELLAPENEPSRLRAA